MADKLELMTLMKAAEAARARAYAPYSGIKVGAAVLTADGAVFVGVNVENASYGVTLCAERAALAAAVAAGARDLTAIAVAGPRGTSPCGVCRQTLWELMPRGTVAWIDNRGGLTSSDVATLLPDPFGE